MRFGLFLRRLHAWGGILIALPVFVIVTTGVLLQLKKELSFVQPPEKRGSEGEPRLSLPQFLEIARRTDSGVTSWANVDRVDYRPSKGMVKLLLTTGVEVQIDAQTGDVLQTAERRSDFIESLHDGSWFHGLVKHWIFLPAGIILFGLLMTGVYLFLIPIRARRRRSAA